jgi:hypothetical protein
MAENCQHVDLALSLMQLHYDPGYAKCRARTQQPLQRIEAAGLDARDLDDIAARVMQAAAGKGGTG